jgi:hypothetical protein
LEIIEMPETEQAEQNLDRLEFALRKDKAPSLYDHNVGFQLLEDNENEDKAVGIRAFKLEDGPWLYAPIFFINGEAKGDELLYVVEKDMMIPFDEKWVDYMLSKESLSLGVPGKGSGESTPDLGEILSVPKTEAEGFSVGSVKGACVRILEAEDQNPEIDLSSIIKEAGFSAREGLASLMLSSQKVGEAILERVPNLHGILFSKEARTEVDKDQGEAIAQPICKDEPKVKVIIGPGRTDDPKSKETIMTQGYDVIDRRTQDELATPLNMAALNLTTLGTTGFYGIMTQDGPAEALVISTPRKQTNEWGPMPTEGRERVDIVFWDKKTLVDRYTTRDEEIAAVNDSNISSKAYWEEKYEELPSTESISPDVPGEKIVFIGPGHGEVYGPVGIWEVIGLPNGQTQLKGSGKTILVTRSAGKLVDTKDKILIPGTWKVIKTQPGDLALPTITEMMSTVGKAVNVKAASYGWNISGHAGSYRPRTLPQAVEALMVNYDLRQSDAESIVKQASEADGGWISHLIKEAQPPMMDPSMMGMGMAMPGGGMGGMGAPPGMPPVDPAMGGMMAAPPPSAPAATMAADLANQAVQSGQGDVLDASALSAMLSLSDENQFIKKYLGDLLTAVDRLGKILFILYWNYRDFTEAYGESDIQQLEDHLVNAFKQLGTIVLDLKDKVAKPDQMPLLE